ncbi:MAG: outer membrane beta-barrel protein [Elusimicrobiaceae bacterium]|nr:outer membrane beta-barrel protein [Elusimicrobiaceae bacterium]
MKNLFSKKIWLLVLILCFSHLSLFAKNLSFEANEGLSAGNSLFSVNLGGNFPFSTTDEKDMYGEDIEWGDYGLQFGAQYLFFISDNLALGFDFQRADFEETSFDLQYRDAYGTVIGTEELKIKTKTNNFMLAGRINILSNGDERLYVPIGIGVSQIKGKLKGPGGSISLNDSSLSGYFGLGVEADINQNFIFGFEGRINFSNFKKNSYDMDYNINYFSLLAKIGFKI